MRKIYFLWLFFLDATFLFVSGEEACITLDSGCSAQQHCCPISNGKSYCNVNSGRCEAIRYCEESSSSKCPFDDLSAKELEDVVKMIKGSNLFSSKIAFTNIRKQEPKKKDWNSDANSAKERIAYAAVFDISRSILSEVLISLTNQRIIIKKNLPNSTPLVTNYEFDYAKELLRNDPKMINAYERRGLNMSYAAFDMWAYGADGNSGGKVLLRAVIDYKDPSAKYMDWCPLEGLEATVDLSQGKVINFIDEGDVPVPKPPQLLVEDPPKPDDSSQGSSIKVNGFIINWKNWKFQYSMDVMHGLQLYHIRYHADCEERFLIYKLSIAEMYVPYGAEGKTWRWRGAFDAGEYGLGKNAAPLTLGQDVPGDAILLSCPQVDDKTGEVSELKGCIALYEKSIGSWYKHYDSETSSESAKVAGSMVAAFMCTIGNYDYMFEYVFQMDGNINVGVYATGLLLQRAIPQVRNDPNCIEDCQDFINENAIAPSHQHFFNYRIDFDIEGTNNMLLEVDFVNNPKGPRNRDGGAFSLRRKIIRKESSRDYSAPNARFWSVINPQSRNKFHTPRGYAIHPTSITPNFLKPGGSINQAMFINHPIWVTGYKDDEQAAAGDYPRTGQAGQGLPQYIKDQESLNNNDIVVWHTFGITHPPRPEEFPIMNAMRVGFNIVSRNFQSSNPMVSMKNQCDSEVSSMKFM